MKNKNHIISGLLLSLLIGAQMLAVPVGMAYSSIATDAAGMAAQDAQCMKDYGTTCDVYFGVQSGPTKSAPAPAPTPEPTAPVATNPAPADPNASVVSKAQEDQILNGGDTVLDTSTPAGADQLAKDAANSEAAATLAKQNAEEEAAAAAAAEKLCTDAGYKDCDEYKNALKSTSGQGFKLNLNAFTLTSDGKQQGQAIFNNPNYDVKKYGPIVATLLSVIDILVKLIGSFALLTLITAGIFMIANHGDEAWVTKGKGMMLYSILGILFALLSYALVNVIQSALA